jgi:hypothetical protein
VLGEAPGSVSTTGMIFGQLRVEAQSLAAGHESHGYWCAANQRGVLMDDWLVQIELLKSISTRNVMFFVQALLSDVNDTVHFVMPPYRDLNRYAVRLYCQRMCTKSVRSVIRWRHRLESGRTKQSNKQSKEKDLFVCTLVCDRLHRSTTENKSSSKLPTNQTHDVIEDEHFWQN